MREPANSTPTVEIRSRRSKTIKAKISPAEIDSLLTDIMERKPHAKGHPLFPHTFRVLESCPGDRSLIEISDDLVVRHIKDEAVTNAILTYTRNQLAPKWPKLLLSHRAAQNAMKYFKGTSTPLKDEIVPIAFKSDKRHTYYRLPFDPVEGATLEQCPRWAEILGRMSNAEAFCLRIASIFDPNADRKQAVYIHGPKDSGKSQIQAALAFIGGQDAGEFSAYVTLSNSDFRTSFWKGPLVGKRILAVGEACPQFLNRDEFKSLTGDDHHSVNEKHDPIRQVRLSTLVFFFSNEEPVTDGDPAKIERIIECNIKPVPLTRENLLPPSEYLKGLLDEMPSFIGYAQNLYAAFRGGRIPCDQDNLHKIAASTDSEALDFFEHHFVADLTSRIRVSEVYKYVKGEVPSLSAQDYGRWKDSWCREHQIKVIRPSVRLSNYPDQTTRVQYFEGMRLRRPDERPHVRLEEGPFQAEP